MPKRDVKLGMKRGVARLCPQCGEGRLFDGYLKVRMTCDQCGNLNGLYRADDAAPYFTVLLVGHLVVAPMLTLGIVGTWPLAWLFGLLLPLITVVTLVLLPFVKGAVLGVLWSFDHAVVTKSVSQEPLP